jgi:hypothetical protein
LTHLLSLSEGIIVEARPSKPGFLARLGSLDLSRVARWRGIYDDKGRVMVAICQNSDLGDSWEWLNNPRYPLRFSDLGIRIGVNYVVYAMTH